MITVRKSSDRGSSRFSWLDSRHTFSFADYHDPAFSGFSDLLVINDDRVDAARGFGRHGHRDMEILSYVVEGALAHQDSLGNGSTIHPGELQRMSAGTGVLHSELNPSAVQPVRFLQIWILPERRGLEPSYEQREFPEAERRGRLRLVASRDGREGSVVVHQDANVYGAPLAPGQSVQWPLAAGRCGWLQVVRGAAVLGDVALSEGDGARVQGERELALHATREAELLLFDLRADS